MRKGDVAGAVFWALGIALAPAHGAAQSASAGPLPGKLAIVVPYGPGNGLDLLAREFAESLRT